MKLQRNKTLSTIALILILTISSLMAAVSTANAHTPPLNIPTWAFLSVAPNPVGVGQSVSVNFWIDKLPPTAFNVYGDRWHNMKVTVTKPDGTIETLGPFTSDDVGSSHTTYTPTVTGTYTFVFNFPGQVLTGENPVVNGPPFGVAYINDTYEASQSPSVKLIVQQQPILPLPLPPLPTGYWQRPIPALNINWNTISGNWLGLATVSFGTTGMYYATENFNPYTTAPNTAHIVWTKPYAFGGLIGGEFGGTETNSNFMSTSQYEPKFAPIIMNGVLYYTLYPGSSSNPEGWVAVDIRTGQTLWTKNTTTTLMLGQIYMYVSPSQYGGIPYLWDVIFPGDGVAPTPNTETFGMYDAMTGNWILNIVNVTAPYGLEIPQVSWVEANDGSLLGYYVDPTSNTLDMWNSSLAIINYSQNTGQNTDYWTWRPPQGANIDWSLGIEWSVPITTTMTAANGAKVPIPGIGISAVTSDVILMSATPGGTFQLGYTYRAGYSAINGALLWGPLNQTETPWTRLSSSPALDGVFAEQSNELVNQWTGYSIATGQKLWGPTANPNTQDVFGYYTISSMIAYGKLYTADLGGYVNAYDLQTGKLSWTYFLGNSGFESPYGAWPIFHIDAIADGKIYIMGGHVYNPPLFRGSQLWAIDATSGQKVWSIYNYPTTNSASAAIADGYLVEPNAYDNQIYCYGKGRSATAVTATPGVGNVVTIQGTVTDQSPGQTSLGVPAAGTPAISDDSMTQWMEYLYMQQTKPTDATGVPVILTATGSNGQAINVGTVTSDVNGQFKIAWTPPSNDLYTITASFAGSNSYFSSSAETGLSVSGTTSADSLGMYIIIATVVIIIAIAIAVVILRRK
jgi:hypothetical protein